MRRLGVLVIAGLVFLPGAGLADNPTLVGTVGPGFSISLADAAGQPVKNVDPGDYTIQVHDQSVVHSFHLVGTGVDQATGMTYLQGDTNGDGVADFQLDLENGYKLTASDLHLHLGDVFA